ncbi:MAG: 30S ribosomal protein S2 [Patescibacteria group bacterium]
MQKTDNSQNLIENMFKAGAHYGYGKSRRHPSTSSYIYTTKNKTDIIDLEKTAAMLEVATEFVKSLGAKNKTILFVGTKPEAKEAVVSMAESLGMPYVAERWIGGTLSNFSEIKKRIAELENYRKDSLSGGLDKYTKKERVVLSKKMERLSKYYSGLVGVKKTPDAVFIVDTKKEHIALAECKTSNVPVIGLLNSDSNMKGVDYPILANDAGSMSIKFFTNHIANAYKSTAGTQNLKA